MRALALALLAGCLLAACGQKGNLYLPEDRVAVTPPETATQTAEDREREAAARNPGN